LNAAGENTEKGTERPVGPVAWLLPAPVSPKPDGVNWKGAVLAGALAGVGRSAGGNLVSGAVAATPGEVWSGRPVDGPAAGRALASRFSELTVGNVLKPELKFGCGVRFEPEPTSCREKAVKGAAALAGTAVTSGPAAAGNASAGTAGLENAVKGEGADREEGVDKSAASESPGPAGDAAAAGEVAGSGCRARTGCGLNGGCAAASELGRSCGLASCPMVWKDGTAGRGVSLGRAAGADGAGLTSSSSTSSLSKSSATACSGTASIVIALCGTASREMVLGGIITEGTGC
jgi:hypothetical protein